MSRKGSCILSKLLTAAVVSLVMSLPSLAQMLTPLVSQPKDGIDLAFLMTDGTVVAQDYINPERWWKLTPDINGSYVNGTWHRLASSWAPTISHIESHELTRGSTYKIGGTQFNGLSQACAFGDEFQCAENYPLVRITNKETNHVFYARTHDHSTMGVATGAKHVWTYFDVPMRIENGASTLVVVANGIPSAPISVTVY